MPSTTASEQRTPRQAREAYRAAMLAWMEAMMAAYRAMNDADRADFDAWERKHVGGDTGTCDWPGWPALIGEPPTPPGTTTPEAQP